MEKAPEAVSLSSNYLNLKKSFRQGVRSLLTALPFEDFSKAFPRFTGAEQGRLYELYIEVITSLHEDLQDEFNSLCQQTQVATVMDKIEHFVELQTLDPLFAQKTNVNHVKGDLLAAKKNEIQLLEGLLDKAEEQKQQTKARIKLLKKKSESASGARTIDILEKFKSAMINYGEN